jgi:hypothetical protein
MSINRMLKNSASIVLASLRDSPYGDEYDSSLRHWALTNSRPSANVTLIILRVADLAAAARGMARLGAPGLGG